MVTSFTDFNQSGWECEVSGPHCHAPGVIDQPAKESIHRDDPQTHCEDITAMPGLPHGIIIHRQPVERTRRVHGNDRCYLIHL